MSHIKSLYCETQLILFSDFTPDYLNMDSAELDYPNGSELGEIFAALESLKQELQV